MLILQIVSGYFEIKVCYGKKLSKRDREQGENTTRFCLNTKVFGPFEREIELIVDIVGSERREMDNSCKRIESSLRETGDEVLWNKIECGKK